MGEPPGPAAERASAALLWEACRRHPEPAAVQAAVEAGAAAELVVPAALAQGLDALLWRAVTVAGVQSALEPYRSWLARLAEVRRLEGVLLVPRALRAALEPLTGAGLEPVVLKGPSLAARYSEPGLRSMSDIDLLLPARQHPAALQALERAGWKVVRPTAIDRYDSVLRHPAVPELFLELHHHVEPRHLRVTEIDAETLWESRLPVELMGTAGYALPVEEEMVFLAQHAGKPFHSFRRLVWVADLAVVVGERLDAGEDVDWDRVRHLAMSWRCATLVAAALGLAARIGVSSPAGLLPRPEQGWRADALDFLLDEGWPLHCDDEADYQMRYALCDLPGRRLRLLVGSRYVMSEVPLARWALDLPRETAQRLVRAARAARRLRRRRRLPVVSPVG